jgi:hypothetical protein
MIIFFILIISLTVIYFITRGKYVNVCTISGRCYKVMPENGKKSADILDTLYLKYIKLQQYMSDTGKPSRKIADKFRTRLSRENIMELESSSGLKGFTTDKGKILKIKLKTDDNKYIDTNNITYVFLHELAHIMSDSYGHNNEFNENFRFILKLAIQKGLYIPSNDNSIYICGSKKCIYKYT